MTREEDKAMKGMCDEIEASGQCREMVGVCIENMPDSLLDAIHDLGVRDCEPGLVEDAKALRRRRDKLRAKP